jgi:hypothetical protein
VVDFQQLLVLLASVWNDAIDGDDQVLVDIVKDHAAGLVFVGGIL